MRKIFVIFSILFTILIAGCSNNGSGNTNIEITKNSVVVEEVDLIVGDKVTLEAQYDKNAQLVWESSNPSVISIDENGNIEVLAKGNAVITVYVKDAPYITDSIYVKGSNKIQQVGVGSGASPEDPIFKGNEGEDEPLEIRFIEMQHIYSDSIFIKKGNVEILIDAGYEIDGLYVDTILEQYCPDKRLDVFMASHSDGDHINGVANALKNIENISLMVDYGGVGTGNVKAARDKYVPKGTQYHSAYDCVNGLNGARDVYYLTKDLYFEVLNTGSYITNTETSASNPHSLVVLFYYKDFTFLTGGDMTTETEAKLLKNENLPEVALFKSPHHGSHGSNSQEFLDAINPKAVAISAARAGQYNVTPSSKPQQNVTYNLNAASGHPAAAAIERIYKAPNISQNLNVYWNAVNGTMKFTTYGKNDFTFQGSPTIRGYYDLTKTDGKGVWNEELQDFENRVTGEENFKLHESKVFLFRDYVQYLPKWAQEEYFPNN